MEFASKEEALAFLQWIRAINPSGGRVANGRFLFLRKQPFNMRRYPGLDPGRADAKAERDMANDACRAGGPQAN